MAKQGPEASKSEVMAKCYEEVGYRTQYQTRNLEALGISVQSSFHAVAHISHAADADTLQAHMHQLAIDLTNDDWRVFRETGVEEPKKSAVTATKIGKSVLPDKRPSSTLAPLLPARDNEKIKKPLQAVATKFLNNTRHTDAQLFGQQHQLQPSEEDEDDGTAEGSTSEDEDASLAYRVRRPRAREDA